MLPVPKTNYKVTWGITLYHYQRATDIRLCEVHLWTEIYEERKKTRFQVRSEALGCAGSSFVTLMCHSVRLCITSCQALISDVSQMVMCSAITPCRVISLFRSRNIHLKRIKSLWRPGGMVVSCECCVLSGIGLCVGLTSCPEKSYRVWFVWVWLWSLDNQKVLGHYGMLRNEKKNEDGFITSLRNVITNLLSYTVQ